jgi:two-component system chemotaxis response regulator CheY
MKGKILIVDDSALARRTCRAILEHEGYAVLEAQDGLAALERYYIEKPDVVLLDLVMKGMYGLEVLEKLRQMDPDVKVVVVSADVQSSSHDLVQQAGGKGFVNKPFDRAELIQAVDAAMTGAV